MYLCDPSAAFLSSSSSDGIGSQAISAPAAAGATATSGIGRVYPIVPGELPKQFPDQFAPLSLFGFEPMHGYLVLQVDDASAPSVAISLTHHQKIQDEHV